MSPDLSSEQTALNTLWGEAQPVAFGGMCHKLQAGARLCLSRFYLTQASPGDTKHYTWLGSPWPEHCGVPVQTRLQVQLSLKLHQHRGPFTAVPELYLSAHTLTQTNGNAAPPLEIWEELELRCSPGLCLTYCGF